MRFFIGKAERELTEELVGAHGGAEAQRSRVHETSRQLPGPASDRVHELIQDVFLESRIPWKSKRRVEALNEIARLAGGYPYAFEALLNYWAIAKSARMSGWTAP